MSHITSKYEGGKIARVLLPMVIVVRCYFGCVTVTG